MSLPLKNMPVIDSQAVGSVRMRTLEEEVELLFGAMGSAKLRSLAENFGLDSVIGIVHDKIVSEAVAVYGSKNAAGRKLGINRTTLSERMKRKR
jgi:transcriptional regulator of acetoin/glycerol metabolism